MPNISVYEMCFSNWDEFLALSPDMEDLAMYYYYVQWGLAELWWYEERAQGLKALQKD